MSSLMLPTDLEPLVAARVAIGHLLAGLRPAGVDDAPAGARLLSVSVPIDELDPLRLYGAARAAAEDATLWQQPASRRTFVGIGAAAAILLSGPGRFPSAAAAWRSLLLDHRTVGPASGLRGAGPMLLGGATFAERASTDGCWTGFEHGRLEVPTLLLGCVDGSSVLTLSIVIDDGREPSVAARSALERLDRVIDAGSAALGSRHDVREATLREVGARPGRAEWAASVARSSGAVGRGRIDKVVLARRVDIETSPPVDALTVLERLGRRADADITGPLTVFAFGRGGRTFLGATPERLVEAHGRAFRTMALAGTTARGDDPTSDAALATALLSSEKDREEHAVVVEMLRETLTAVAVRLDIERTPHIRRLPTLQHLESEISGELRDDLGILDLVDRLHPTPAVGGWPRAAALELLDEQEHLDRGWYAGPVGWLDAHGDGEFVVAIRSGVLEGARASLFVGCGIVGDSEPDREWAESDMKLQSLASALGRPEP